jgi:hypothetical protein
MVLPALGVIFPSSPAVSSLGSVGATSCEATQAARTAATHEPESRAYYQRKLADRSNPHAKTLALIALARHRTRRLYKLLRRASLEPTELVA